MGLIESLFEHQQNYNIRKVAGRATELERELWKAGEKNRNLNEEVKILRHELARVALVVQSMARVAVKSGAWTQNDLAAMVTEVDAADGVVDGKVTRPAPVSRPGNTFCEGGHEVAPGVAKCPMCNRPVEAAIPMCGCGRLDCLYCG